MIFPGLFFSYNEGIGPKDSKSTGS